MYRTIDQDGQVVDAFFSKHRNAAAAQAFFERAMDGTGCTPVRVTPTQRHAIRLHGGRSCRTSSIAARGT